MGVHLHRRRKYFTSARRANAQRKPHKGAPCCRSLREPILSRRAAAKTFFQPRELSSSRMHRYSSIRRCAVIQSRGRPMSLRCSHAVCAPAGNADIAGRSPRRRFAARRCSMRKRFYLRRAPGECKRARPIRSHLRPAVRGSPAGVRGRGGVADGPLWHVGGTAVRPYSRP